MATLIAFACGSTSGGGGAKGTIKIGSDLPTCTAGGKSTQNGIDFAIKQKNAAGGVSGFTIQFVPFDVHFQQRDVPRLSQVVETPRLHFHDIFGIVGSRVGQMLMHQRLFGTQRRQRAAQSFTMVSPSNTNPCLTKDLSTCSYHPQDLRGGKPNNYFRVVTTDDYQGPAMADYAYKTLNLKNVGVLDDSTVFGAGIADTFSSEFKKLGGTVTRDSYKKEQTSDWRSKLLTFKAAGAQAVYVGGTDDQNICIPRKQMKQIGWDAPYMGGDGIETPDCINQASGNEVGISATSAGADATQIPGPTITIHAFRAAFPQPNDFGGYTMQAYDATNALMAAIGRAINDANGSMPSREQVRKEMAATKGFVGVIGTYDFDQNGDNSLKIVSIYTVQAVSDPTQSTGVCGKTASKDCFVWKTQFDFAKSSG